MTTMPRSVVIVGAGQAGVQAASALRSEGYAGAIQLIGNEPGLPYQRPPLSKSYLGGDLADEELHLETAAWFDDQRIEHLPDAHVDAIERHSKRVRLSSGKALEYDHLILATGARNRSLPAMDMSVQGVFSLRTVAEAAALTSSLHDARRVVVIGAGFLGLEVASVAKAQGCDVHVVESVERVMQRALSEEMSEACLRHHRAAGVSFSLSARVDAICSQEGRVTAVKLADGGLLEADLVLIAIGVVPNSELGLACGLEVFNGLMVDGQLRTSDPAISAIGDCAAFPYAFDEGDRLRLESVQNAVDQACYVARRIVGTADTPRYDQVPVFWSDQGGMRLQIAGVARRLDASVLRGDPCAGAFSVLRFRQGRLTGVESFNRPADHMAARRLLQQRISPSLAQAADPAFDLKSLLNAAATV
ncbi:NAD(P)/FAD-dependent oxidoreductase [Paraburkholderia dioscoreae]|uniref:Rhodocoxin reductase n=1 Tax=Paraburkholderia dioscoreae TaxID=2604047 RepID=A0A5Q4ZRC8_9BURK|nr:FAD-dependent oxidoreductase [Paraburkholderia dioscoreae]VVD33760.1 Rhodocoxin reductase [Paraburkholderia dioscoreae]